MGKRLWRCHVCNDLHYGINPPEVCPTCGAKRAFMLIDHDEAMRIIGTEGGEIATRETVIEVWRRFGEQSPEFNLTDKLDEVELLSKGVLENRANKGLKYCPCRIPTGDFHKDLNLICPCNFLRQNAYKETGECWCGLFVKRHKEVP